MPKLEAAIQRKWLQSAVTAAALTGLLLNAQASQAPVQKLVGQVREDLISRRNAVRTSLKDGIVLVAGEPEAGDVERVRYRTTNEMIYLTGLEAPGAILALLPEGDPFGAREIMFMRPQGAGELNWNDAIPVPGANAELAAGLEKTGPLSEVYRQLDSSIKAAKTIYLMAPQTMAATIQSECRKINPDIKFASGAGFAIGKLRYFKSNSEINNIQKAIDATAIGIVKASRRLKPGVTEMAVEGAVLDGFRSGGAPREGYPCIVGSGPFSCVLHHPASDRVVGQNEMVVMDVGAEYNYYSADITRTFPSSGTFTPRQKQVYQLVLDAQRAAEKVFKPGVSSMGDLTRAAINVMKQSPLRAKDSAGNLKSLDSFFIHGLGHPIGLDVHDFGMGGRLETGVCFTIEPGIYIPSENLGVRIEDDYLVTPTGLKKLSANIPSEITAIETMMRTAAK